MNIKRFASAAAAAALLAVPASASARPASGAVFVQNDDPTGNAVVAYDRAADGSLRRPASTRPAAGRRARRLGRRSPRLPGLADARPRPALRGQRRHEHDHGLRRRRRPAVRREVLPSGGAFPSASPRTGTSCYVLNARNGGVVAGLPAHRRRGAGAGLEPRLGLDPAPTPEFTTRPGQVAFTPDGSRLVVTTKANGNTIDVSASPVGRPLVRRGDDARRHGAVRRHVRRGRRPRRHRGRAERGRDVQLHRDGTLTPLAPPPTGQAATCWIVDRQRPFYVSNAGSGTVSGVRRRAHGLGNTATDAGTVDAAVSRRPLPLRADRRGRHRGCVPHRPGGSLTAVGTVAVPGAVGGEGSRPP